MTTPNDSTVHTVLLPTAPTLGTHQAFPARTASPTHNRCEHEARSSRGVFHRCRRRGEWLVNGMHVCAQHRDRLREG